MDGPIQQLLPATVILAAEPVTLAELCRETLHWVAIGIGLIGVVVITYGVLRSALTLIGNEVKPRDDEARSQLRVDLGYYLLLGLEFLVAADVIETLLAPDLEHLAVLGIIVVIRTVISFSLNWELEQHAEKHNPPTTSNI